MHNQITKRAAEKVQERINRSEKPVAVFARYGSWQAYKVGTTVFDNRLSKTPEELIGCYDIFAMKEYIEDDLAAAGIK